MKRLIRTAFDEYGKYQVWELRDSRGWVPVATTNAKTWNKLARLMGHPRKLGESKTWAYWLVQR